MIQAGKNLPPRIRTDLGSQRSNAEKAQSIGRAARQNDPSVCHGVFSFIILASPKEGNLFCERFP